MSAGGEKKRITVTLSAENVQWMDDRYNNRSGFLDDLVTQCRNGDGRAEEALQELRAEQLMEEAEDLKAESKRKKREAERKRQKAQEYLKQKEKVSEQAEAELADARDALLDNDGVILEPTNPAVQNWADKLGMTPVELIEELERDE